MSVNLAALTLMCLAFSTGFLLVVSFIQKPIFPLLAMPHVSREHESDVRWIHSAMQELIRYAGTNVMLPVTLFAALAACLQAWQRGFDVVSVFLAIGASCMVVMASFVLYPAARGVRDTRTYEDEFEEVARPLFRLVRMHHTMLLGLVPLMLAQLALLFY